MKILTIIIILVIVVVFFLVKRYTSSNTQIKSKAIKKSEIIDDYKKQLRDMIVSCKEDENLILVKRKELLKQFNQELSLNIFFDKNEIRQTLNELVNYK